MQHLFIVGNLTSINIDNVLTGALPDLVIVVLMSDADHAAGYQINLLNYQNFIVNCIYMIRNSTLLPRESYTRNFANDKYKIAYMTFVEELECECGKSLSFIKYELANGNTLISFQINDSVIKRLLRSEIQVCTGCGHL